MNFIRKYNIFLILFLLCLTNFQEWYLVWLFASIMWQKPKMIKNIIAISLISEVANSVYMFKSEKFVYDKYFVIICIITFIIWDIVSSLKNKKINIQKD
jgi:hypothetical protein